MLNRRQAIVGGSAAIAACVASIQTSGSEPAAWTPIKSGQRKTLNDVSYEAECGPNPVAIQQARSGIVRIAMLRGNGWHEDDKDQVERAELDGWPSHMPVKDPIWTAWSMYIEPGIWSTSDWCILHQLFQVKGMPLSHILKPGGVLHWVGADANYHSGAWPTRYNQKIEQGVWLNFVETYKFDPLGGDGYWKSWLNGRQVLDFKGALGTKGVVRCYTKFGIYRGVQQTWNGVTPVTGPAPVQESLAIRYANMRFGKQDLSQLIGAPEPAPVWEPWA